MNKSTTALAVLISLGLWQPIVASAAGFIDDSDGMLDMSQYLSENRYGFLPVPVVITEPAVGYGGGLFGLFLHETADSEASKNRTDGRAIPPAITAFGSGATQNGTWFVGGGHRHTWNNDSIRYLVGLGYANVNIDLYSGDIAGFESGKGISTQTTGYGGMQKLSFRVADTPFFLGGSQVYANMKVTADNKLINRTFQRVLGEESSTSGVGLLMEYDTTDNFFYPHSGLSATAEYQFFSSFLGGDYRYDMLVIDGKYFQPLSADFTLALAGNYQSLTNHDSHLPPMVRPYISLRGISRYRYQGDYVGTVQTQLAWQMTPRWVLQGFVGAGSAENNADEIFQTAEVAWGGGFRYLIAREYGLHTGIDVAFSDDEQAVYFNVGAGL
ncbi:MAG TPA: BamA/TamA family outer membrane protein [Buttiauxella sp.]|uniref:BamA/TamA family outer membrane protein n=1 Tax=Buttiauxella sp. TaxID=1972222 RepID=UPI002B4668F1|nr:BamA/TamA family outer membrane protein [Buttiauxella sp.]HKM95457.1 BamA/TamA family outer membrane protein [Buttiauxella sp.]